VKNAASLRPRLVVTGAARAIDYYTKVFGAIATERHTGADGSVVHAELEIGDAVITLKDEDATDRAPSAGETPVLLMLEVDDVDAVAERMVAEGGTVVFAVQDSGYGRGGRVADPFGHVWMISQRAAGGTDGDSGAAASQRDAPGLDTPGLDALTDLQTPWCVHVAATLRIAEHIDAGKTAIGDLAAAAGCDAAVLESMLTYLATKGVFTQPAPGRFGLNATARQLLAPSHFLGLDGIGGRMAHAWGTLLTFVRTGKSGYREAFGMPFWEDLAAHPSVAASFDALMGTAGHGTPNPHFDITGGWEPVRTVVDVGGGTGAMLAEVLRIRPAIRGTLVDLPGTVARVGDTFEAAGVAGRVTVVGQSFFDPLPPAADVYLLKKVLNDWPDAETAAILRRCAEAAKPDGRVVVLGGVAPDGEPRPLAIDMVVCGGRTSTVTEFTSLARRAGLEVVAAGEQASGYFAVECRPI
jgi:2,7-dihydroxy-5-methyl-1-naphthoate 7-O-methyltransferase